jgi:hypothetical protein
MKTTSASEWTRTQSTCVVIRRTKKTGFLGRVFRVPA